MCGEVCFLLIPLPNNTLSQEVSIVSMVVVIVYLSPLLNPYVTHKGSIEVLTICSMRMSTNKIYFSMKSDQITFNRIDFFYLCFQLV